MTDRGAPRVTVSIAGLAPSGRGRRRPDRARALLGGLHGQGGGAVSEGRGRQPAAARDRRSSARSRAERGRDGDVAFVRFSTRVRARLFKLLAARCSRSGSRPPIRPATPGVRPSTGPETRVRPRSFCEFSRQEGCSGLTRRGDGFAYEGEAVRVCAAGMLCALVVAGPAAASHPPARLASARGVGAAAWSSYGLSAPSLSSRRGTPSLRARAARRRACRPRSENIELVSRLGLDTPAQYRFNPATGAPTRARPAASRARSPTSRSTRTRPT